MPVQDSPKIGRYDKGIADEIQQVPDIDDIINSSSEPMVPILIPEMKLLVPYKEEKH